MDEPSRCTPARQLVIFSRPFRLANVLLAARHFANRIRERRRGVDLGALIAVTAIAIVFRVWNLGDKALWLDEWLTAFIANGYGLANLPLDRWLFATDLQAIAAPHPDAGFWKSLTVLNNESTHPPLFFALQQGWTQWLTGRSNDSTLTSALSPEALPIALRALPATFGVFQTIAAFFVGHLAFSRRVGLLAAALTATSPLTVYLSQEARHYTLAMLCFTVALGGLLAVVQRWQYGDLRARKAVLTWIVANTIGLYVHYLYILAFGAQAIAIGLWLQRTQQWRKRRRFVTAVLPGFAMPLLLFAPWLWQLAQQIQRSETAWAEPFVPHWSDALAPIGQTLVGMLSAFVVLPVEGQSLTVVILLGLVALISGLTIAVLAVLGWQQLHEISSMSPESARLHERRQIVATISLAIVVQMLAAFYLFGKDLTIAPRYHAIYYPSLSLLVAICLGGHAAYRPSFGNWLRHLPVFGTHWRRSLIAIVLAIGTLGSVFVIHDLAFQKGYTPRAIADRIQARDDRATLTVATYENLQEAALGWSVLWELARQIPETSSDTTPHFTLLDRRSGYASVWETLTEHLATDSPTGKLAETMTTFDLWVLAPGLRQAEFPEVLGDRNGQPESLCWRDDDRYDRIGIPYQGYRCGKSPQDGSIQ